MKKLLVVGVIVLFIGLALSPSIYAETDNQTVPAISDNDVFEYDKLSPVQLMFLLIHKLLNHEEIQIVDSVDDVEQLVESDAELSGIFEELMSYSCGCEESSTLKWNFPVICTLLVPFAIFVYLVYFVSSIRLGYIIGFIGIALKCFWIFLF